MSEPACSFQLDLHRGSVFASRLRTRVFSVLFSFVNWVLSGSWSRHRVIFSKLLSVPACSSLIDLHWASPHLPWGMQRICGPFFLEFIYVFREILSASMFFCCSIHIETAQNSREERNEFAELLFWRLSTPFKRLFVLWHSLIRSLYFIQVYIFKPLIQSAPFLRFSHISLYTNFSWCILPREIFFLHLMTLLLGI